MGARWVVRVMTQIGHTLIKVMWKPLVAAWLRLLNAKLFPLVWSSVVKDFYVERLLLAPREHLVKTLQLTRFKLEMLVSSSSSQSKDHQQDMRELEDTNWLYDKLLNVYDTWFAASTDATTGVPLTSSERQRASGSTTTHRNSNDWAHSKGYKTSNVITSSILRWFGAEVNKKDAKLDEKAFAEAGAYCKTHPSKCGVPQRPSSGGILRFLFVELPMKMLSGMYGFIERGVATVFKVLGWAAESSAASGWLAAAVTTVLVGTVAWWVYSWVFSKTQALSEAALEALAERVYRPIQQFQCEPYGSECIRVVEPVAMFGRVYTSALECAAVCGSGAEEMEALV